MSHSSVWVGWGMLALLRLAGLGSASERAIAGACLCALGCLWGEVHAMRVAKLQQGQVLGTAAAPSQ